MEKPPMPDQQLLAPCGIDCTACDIFKAAQDREFAVRLAETWRSGNPNVQPEWFRCQGCRGDRSLRWSEDCHIAGCCEEKAIADCSCCTDFPCQPYLDWIDPYPHHQAAYERLKEMAAQRASR
jgi:hypothetical protein